MSCGIEEHLPGEDYRVVSAVFGLTRPGPGWCRRPVGCCSPTRSGPSGWTASCRRRWRRGEAAGRARPGQDGAGSGGRLSRWAGTAWPMSRCCAAEPGVFGLVASDPTVSRTIDALAADATGCWRRSTPPAPRPGRGCGRGRRARPRRRDRRGGPMVIDMDATLVTAHSDKQRRGANVQAGLRVPPVVGVRRPRRRRDR